MSYMMNRLLALTTGSVFLSPPILLFSKPVDYAANLQLCNIRHKDAENRDVLCVETDHVTQTRVFTMVNFSFTGQCHTRAKARMRSFSSHISIH